MSLYVKRLHVTLSPEAAQFIRDSIFDTADFVEDAIQSGDVTADAIVEGQRVEAANVIEELRRFGSAIESAILVPATPSEFNEILNIH